MSNNALDRTAQEKRFADIFARLHEQDIEQFYAHYQLWVLRRRVPILEKQLDTLREHLTEHQPHLQKLRPSALALAVLARLQSNGVSNIDVLDLMLDRGENWLDRMMQRLDYCENVEDFIQGDYTQWCIKSLEGAYDWMDSLLGSIKENGSQQEIIRDDMEATEELLLQKLSLDDGEELPAPWYSVNVTESGASSIPTDIEQANTMDDWIRVLEANDVVEIETDKTEAIAGNSTALPTFADQTQTEATEIDTPIAASISADTDIFTAFTELEYISTSSSEQTEPELSTDTVSKLEIISPTHAESLALHEEDLLAEMDSSQHETLSAETLQVETSGVEIAPPTVETLTVVAEMSDELAATPLAELLDEVTPVAASDELAVTPLAELLDEEKVTLSDAGLAVNLNSDEYQAGEGTIGTERTDDELEQAIGPISIDGLEQRTDELTESGETQAQTEEVVLDTDRSAMGKAEISSEIETVAIVHDTLSEEDEQAGQLAWYEYLNLAKPANRNEDAVPGESEEIKHVSSDEPFMDKASASVSQEYVHREEDADEQISLFYLEGQTVERSDSQSNDADEETQPFVLKEVQTTQQGQISETQEYVSDETEERHEEIASIAVGIAMLDEVAALAVSADDEASKTEEILTVSEYQPVESNSASELEADMGQASMHEHIEIAPLVRRVPDEKPRKKLGFWQRLFSFGKKKQR